MADQDTTPSVEDTNQAQAGQDGSTEDTATAQTQDNSQDNSQDTTQDGGSQEEDQRREDKPEAKDSQDADQDSTEDQDAEEDMEDPALNEAARRKLSKVRREARNLRERLGAETERADQEARRADRAEVAHQAGLPPESLKFLTGDTREELENNAADLLAMLGYQGRVVPSGNPQEVGVTDSASTRETTPDIDAIGARIYSDN